MDFHTLNPSLMDFVRIHNFAAVRVALQKSFDLESMDSQLKTPLMIATENQDFEIASFLVDAGANINAQDIFKNTPFMVASAEGHLDLIRKMLRSTPDFRIVNRYGGNALTCACERGHVKVVQEILTSNFIFNIEHRDEFGWTPLIETIVLGDGGDRYQEICHLLIRAGANFDARDLEGKTCFDHAVRRGFNKIADILSLYRTEKNISPIKNELS